MAAGLELRLWNDALNRQAFLGDNAFVERKQALLTPATKEARMVPMRQRGAPRRLADWLYECGNRDEALWMAHTRSGLRKTAMAAELGLSVARVSQLVARVEADQRRTG